MRGASARLLTFLILLCASPVAVQGAAQAAPRLPAYRGQVERFTLAPDGIMDRLLLTDGTELATPPYLSTQTGVAIRPGNRMTVYGLKSASLALVQTVPVADERTGRTVVAEPRRKPKPSEILAKDSEGVHREHHVGLDGEIRKSKTGDPADGRWTPLAPEGA